MPDIKLRFNKDMLVLSSPVLSALARLGIDVAHDTELTLLLEPDTLEDAYRLESIAGAQCLVACTSSLTPARLAQSGMEARAGEIARAALAAVRALTPQHVLVEIGPCGLPLDPSSKASLMENRDQYARAGRLFAEEEFDAFFLNGFMTCDDLKCALMGLRKVSDAPIFASVSVRADGTLASGRGTIDEAARVMEEFEASVAGFATAAAQDEAASLAARMRKATGLPLLAQLEVGVRDAQQFAPTKDNPYYAPDTMMPAADALRAAGVQFLRAAGDATPAYTGALAATMLGVDALARATSEAEVSTATPEEDLSAFVERARARVAAALDGNLQIVEHDGPAVDEAKRVD
ncbi:MAG: homocysteine S-methyltransferase family protein [Eggerthellaceae bacterium]|nr:homocysteine S-methyltransferase family protein [Eggerthellaceae bacterium]